MRFIKKRIIKLEKLIAQKDLNDILNNLRAEEKTIVATNGCFDILHVGHVRYLKKAKELGDVLIVALNSDNSVKQIKGPNRPINSELERAEVLSALYFVDYVVLFDEPSPKDLLAHIKPDIYTKGADYTLETLPEVKVIVENGGRIEFIDLVEGKSTTSILEKLEE